MPCSIAIAGFDRIPSLHNPTEAESERARFDKVSSQSRTYISFNLLSAPEGVTNE
jgi:hypothetical protein